MDKNLTADPKPYNKCLTCPHRGLRCDGPRTSAMPTPRWCEFMRDMKRARNMTHADVAEKSGVSIKTIERLMSLRYDQDIMRETARLIEDAIIGSSNQYPCYIAFEEAQPDQTQKLADAMTDLERALADNKDYRAALDGIHESYRAELQKIRDEAQVKIDYLRSEVARAREEADHWRVENARKGQLIDKYMEKIISK